MEEPLGIWAPVIDSENGWVQVSSGGGSSGLNHAGSGGGRNHEMNNACMMYKFLHASPPDWGERGGNKGSGKL